MRPYKVTGWGQELYATSIEKKEAVGTFRRTQDNRGYRYILAGGTLLAAGKLTSSPAEASAHLLDENVAAGQAASIGDMVIKFTSAASVTLTKDELEGGFYIVNDPTGSGAGQMYRISGNQALVGTAHIITLDEPLKVATVVATTQHTIILNPYSKIVICTTVDFFLTGTPQYAIDTTLYGWSQTQGWGAQWGADADAAGEHLMPHTTDGQTIINDAVTEQNVGYQGPGVGVATEYLPVYFTMESHN